MQRELSGAFMFQKNVKTCCSSAVGDRENDLNFICNLINPNLQKWDRIFNIISKILLNLNDLFWNSVFMSKK